MVPWEVNLITGSNNGTATCPQVVDKTALRHVLRDDVIDIAENNTDKSDEVCVPQCPVKQKKRNVYDAVIAENTH